MNTITINNYKDILDQLDAEVCAPNSNPTVQKVIREIKEKIEEIRSSGDALIKENDILKIGVVGQVKAGKSSFLNSLFFDGENVLPRASTPMTAGLTVLEYGEEDVFTVEYYNSKEWEVFKDRAKQYDRIIQENRAAFPSMSDDEIARSIGIQDELASAKELVTKCGRNASDEIQPVSKVVSKAFGSIAGLQEVLSDYVGADGRYTSIVKCLTIKLNDERLKGMRIVDTPGVNDPVVSREQRTREFLRECHGVFFLSFASRFFDSTDVTFLSGRIGEQGIGTVVLIASKFDSVLQDVGMKFKDDLGTAMDDCQRNLKKQYRNNIASSDYKGDDPIFDVSSGIGFSIYKKPKERWDDIERHVVKQMQTFYPSFFGNDSDIKDTFFNLSQMDKMRDDYLEGIFKKNKDKIIAGKMSAYFSNATSNLKKCVTDKLSELQEMMLALESSDISDMRTKKRLLEDVTTKIKDEISSIVSRLDSRAELYYKESTNTFRIDSISNIPTESQEVKVTRKGTFWGGDKSFCITYQGVAVHKLIGDTMKVFDRSIDNLSSDWSRKLSELNKMMKNEMLQIIEDSEQNDKTGKLDADALRRILNNTIEDMQSKGTLEIATQREKLKSSLQSDLQGIEDIKTSFDNRMSEEKAKAEITDAATKSKKEAADAVNYSLSAIWPDVKDKLLRAREDALDILTKNKGLFISKVEESTKEYLTTLEENLADKEGQLKCLKEGLIKVSNIKEKIIMNKINIAKYQDALESKRKELNDYVTTQVANISFQVPTSIADNRKQSPSKTPKAITAAGIVALLAGLMGNSTALSIVGACATTCGGYLLLKSRKDHDSNVPPSVDYRSLARKTYKQLEAIYSHAISDWDNSLGAQKDTLKNEIQLLQVEAEKKNALMDIAIKRSVISFSMLNIMSTLNNVAKDGNINAFKTCNETFVEQLTSAINLAYREQSKHYADMDSILTAQKQ